MGTLCGLLSHFMLFSCKIIFLHFTLFCYSLCLKNNSRKKYEICIFSFSCFLKCKAFVNLLTPKKLAPADVHFFLLLLFSIWPCWLFGSNFHASTFGQSAAMHLLLLLLFSLSCPITFWVDFSCFEKSLVQVMLCIFLCYCFSPPLPCDQL